MHLPFRLLRFLPHRLHTGFCYLRSPPAFAFLPFATCSFTFYLPHCVLRFLPAPARTVVLHLRLPARFYVFWFVVPAVSTCTRSPACACLHLVHLHRSPLPPADGLVLVSGSHTGFVHTHCRSTGHHCVDSFTACSTTTTCLPPVCSGSACLPYKPASALPYAYLRLRSAVTTTTHLPPTVFYWFCHLRLRCTCLLPAVTTCRSPLAAFAVSTPAYLPATYLPLQFVLPACCTATAPLGLPASAPAHFLHCRRTFLLMAHRLPAWFVHLSWFHLCLPSLPSSLVLDAKPGFTRTAVTAWVRFLVRFGFYGSGSGLLAYWIAPPALRFSPLLRNTGSAAGSTLRAAYRIPLPACVFTSAVFARFPDHCCVLPAPALHTTTLLSRSAVQLVHYLPFLPPGSACRRSLHYHRHCCACHQFFTACLRSAVLPFYHHLRRHTTWFTAVWIPPPTCYCSTTTTCVLPFFFGSAWFIACLPVTIYRLLPSARRYCLHHRLLSTWRTVLLDRHLPADFRLVSRLPVDSGTCCCQVLDTWIPPFSPRPLYIPAVDVLVPPARRLHRA